MDVRVRFVLSMVGLFLFIITLSVIIYFVFRDTPAADQDVAAANLNTTPGQSDSVFGFDTVLGDDTEEVPAEEAAAPAELTLRQPENPDQPELPPVSSGAVDEPIYTVRMLGTWNKQVHGPWYPDGAHLSPMVAWSHQDGDFIYELGKTASIGVEIVAETGSPKRIEREIHAVQNEGHITDYAIGNLTYAPGEDMVRVRVAPHTPNITVISMIAPSPDWFVAAKNISLFENGSWVERKRYAARIYDAGTDSGLTFTAEDDDTDPKETIRSIPDQPDIPIVTFEFIRTY